MQDTLAAVSISPGKKTEIRPLTGIRGIAATWVVLFHIFQNDGVHGPFSQILSRGYLAVDIFFILSGFVMALTYSHSAENSWTPAKFGTFLIHRIARIYPLYIVLTFILIAYRVSGSIGIDLCDSPSVSIVSNILLIQNWGICDSYIGPGWSVSTEFAAYLLFPLLLHKLLKRTLLSAFSVFLACLAGLAALCIFLTALAGLGMHGPLDIYGPQRIWPLVRCILGFTLGLAAWRLWDNVQLREKFASPAASWLCAGSLIAILEIPNLDVAFAALAAVFILCLATGNNAVTQFCGSKPVHFMGDISYALYLLHLPLMKLLREEPRLAAYLGQAPAHILALAVYAGVLLSFSILAHRFVEVPCRNKIRQLERGLGVSTTRSDPTPPRPIATDTRQIPKGEPEYPPQRAR